MGRPLEEAEVRERGKEIYFDAMSRHRTAQSALIEVSNRLAAQARVIDALVKWDERWPENRIHSATLFRRCHDELSAIVDDAKLAAGGVMSTTDQGETK